LLAIGCGNALAGDDGVGLEIVRRLEQCGDCECQLQAMPQAGVELLESFEKAETILFIDAVSSGAPPGTLYLARLPCPGLESRALGSVSSHGWGLTEVLALDQALGRQAPRLALLGVEIADVSPSPRLSPAVEKAARVVVEEFAHLEAMLMKTEGDSFCSFRRFLPGETSFPGG